MTDQASARDLADRALDLIDVDPVLARRTAELAVATAARSGDPAATVVARRAFGAVAAMDDDLAVALPALRSTVRAALRFGLAEEAGRTRLELAIALSDAGDHAGALRALTAAATELTDPLDRARVTGLRARVLYHQGRLPAALTAHTDVLADFRRLRDRGREAAILHNRGLVLGELGRLAEAELDFARSEQIRLELDQPRAAVDAQVHLGWVKARRGDVAGALACFDRADAWLVEHGEAHPQGLIDRCEVYLSARLLPEARAAASAAEPLLRERSAWRVLALARLRRSEAALADGDAVEARDAALGMRAVLAGRGEPVLAAQADLAALRVDRLEGRHGADLLRRARRAARVLEGHGWTLLASEARLLAAEQALGLGRRSQAAAELAGIAAVRRSGPVQLRSRAWHAQALLRLAAGDRRGAEAALRSGFAVLERYRAALGATELRAAASRYGTDVARLGLDLALQDRSPVRVLGWAERYRAGALSLPPVRPPADGALAEELESLRDVARAIETALVQGQDTTRLRARQARLEQSVRRRALQVHPSAAPAGAAPIAPGRPAGLDALLAGRVLVELVEHGALLTAVVAGAGRRPVLRDLGDPAAVARELAGLRAALRRRARSAGAAGRDPLTAAAERCDRLLLAPLADLIGDRPLVVVPTGRLHAMPWGMLPTARGREVVVSPSAAIWCRAAADAAFGSPAPGVLLVAGPDLPEAATEVAALAAGYPGATTLTGSEAACAPVLAAITARVGATGLVHLAAHGRFRADNPMFSALLLADGPLTVLDLEGLGGVPDTVILSACDAGLSDVRPGDELMGLAVALTGLGARAVIAAVAPVPDAAVRDFMIDLHDRLRTGLPPAAALAAAARRRRDAGDPAAADAFVCLGAG